MILQQAETVRFLLERLAELDLYAELPKELVAFEQDAESIRVKLSDAEGKEKEAEFAFLVAADFKLVFP